MPFSVRSCRAQPGLRMPGAWDAFETSARIIMGQQVSVAGATTVAGRFAARFGTPVSMPLSAGISHFFPDAKRISEADLSGIGMPGPRARTIQSLASALASGDLDLDGQMSLPDALTALQALPGIGPWTAHLIAGRVLGARRRFSLR